MINFYNQVPSVYNNASRDFQYISWLVNVVLNSVKHNVDDLYSLPNIQSDSRLTELLAMTLGFKVKRNYDQKQLKALVSIIPYILKYKGTYKALDLACIAIIKASGAMGVYSISVDDSCLVVQLPENLVDTVLLMDLLPYILPAGLTVRLISKTVYDSGTLTIDLDYMDTVIADWVPDLAWERDKDAVIGLATMFSDSASGAEPTPEFANFTVHGDRMVNTGLLDNSIIPAITTTLPDDKTSNSQKDEDLPT